MRRRQDSRIYPGRYNGVGGHVERDEDPLTGVRREIFEETGLPVNRLRLRAIYHIDSGAEQGGLLFVFTCWSERRCLHAGSPEGSLHWVPREQLLALPLVEDLPTMLPRYLNMPDDDAPLFIHISYDQDDRPRLREASLTDEPAESL